MISMIFSILFTLISLDVLVRAAFMLIGCLKAGKKDQKEMIHACFLSLAAEIIGMWLVSLTFALSKSGLIPLVLQAALVYLLRSYLSFERSATRCVYSLLCAWLPKQQEVWKKLAVWHIL